MELKFRDLTKDDIEVRIDQIKSTYCTLLLYKNSRVDMNLLDETVGAMNWQRRHSRDNRNCEIGIYDTDKKEWVWKEDTGTESYSEAEKGLASDSFKRAGTNWGIGRELYTKINIRIDCQTEKNEKGKLIVKNLCNFDVTGVEIKDKTIVGLKISAFNKDKKQSEEIFTYGTLKQKQPNPFAGIKDEDLPFNDLPPQEPKMTLKEAWAVEVKTKDGIKALKELTNEQLELGLKFWTVEEWKTAANLVLLERQGRR